MHPALGTRQTSLAIWRDGQRSSLHIVDAMHFNDFGSRCGTSEGPDDFGVGRIPGPKWDRGREARLEFGFVNRWDV